MVTKVTFVGDGFTRKVRLRSFSPRTRGGPSCGGLTRGAGEVVLLLPPPLPPWRARAMQPPKFERFIRPMGLRFKKAHVTHPELKTTCVGLPVGTIVTRQTAHQNAAERSGRSGGGAAPRPGRQVPAAHHRRQEEPELAAVHAAGRDHQGHRHRGQRERAGLGHAERQSRVGYVSRRPGPGGWPRRGSSRPPESPPALGGTGFVTTGKYAQVTNNPENDGCINAVLLV